MSTSAAKRRRIDAASQTLSKPFRSPFKTPFKCPLKGASPAQALDASATTSDTRTPTPCEPKSETPTPLAPRNINTLLLNRGTSKLIPATPRPLRVKKPSSSISTAQIYADPEVARLLREQKAWERKLRELNEELDAAEQASKIERESSKWALKCRENGERVDSDEEIDGELMVLIEKWRGASRLAAEELYGNVRDRVNRMGGPRAWKEAQQKRHEYQNSWDQDEQQTNNNEDDDEGKDTEKRDLYAEYDIDLETENEKSQRRNGMGDTGELPGQEDEFTMAMMLRTLNVDLDIIGYDREEQRWMD